MEDDLYCFFSKPSFPHKIKPVLRKQNCLPDTNKSYFPVCQQKLLQILMSFCLIYNYATILNQNNYRGKKIAGWFLNYNPHYHISLTFHIDQRWKTRFNHIKKPKQLGRVSKMWLTIGWYIWSELDSKMPEFYVLKDKGYFF